MLTAVGERHMRQRKLLLPPFHGDAIAQYRQMILDATEREIAGWPAGRPIALAPRMQAITLDVIMAGIFGIEGGPGASTPERRLREATRGILFGSTLPVAQVAELMNIGRAEPVGLQKAALGVLDRAMYAVIRARRRAADVGERRDILSLLIGARTDDGEALSDSRAARRAADARPRRSRDDGQPAGVDVGAARSLARRARAARRRGPQRRRMPTTSSSRRSRRRCGRGPVVPAIGRRVTVPWRLGEYAVAADTPIQISVLLVHHREDLYPDPFAFRPERWIGRKPGTYEWIPFGGGIRRCLGAALAMTEQRIVLSEMARRLDVRAADPEPERATHRNVTMIPSRGARVVVAHRGR